MNDERGDDLKREDLKKFFAALPRDEAVRLLEAFGAGLFNPQPVSMPSPVASKPVAEPKWDQIAGLSLSETAKHKLLEQYEQSKKHFEATKKRGPRLPFVR